MPCFLLPVFTMLIFTPLAWEGMLCSLRQEGKGHPFSHIPLWEEVGRKQNKRIGEKSEDETRKVRRRTTSLPLNSLSLSLLPSLFLPLSVEGGGVTYAITGPDYLLPGLPFSYQLPAGDFLPTNPSQQATGFFGYQGETVGN